MTFLFCLGQRVSHTGRATVEKVTISRARFPAEGFHQFRTVNAALHVLMSSQTAQPDQRHAIGNYKTCPFENGPKVHFFLRDRDAMHAGHCDIARWSAFRDPRLDPLNGLGNLDCVHAHTEHAIARQRVLRIRDGGGCQGLLSIGRRSKNAASCVFATDYFSMMKFSRTRASISLLKNVL
jgi:hypothetical protein